MYFINYNTGACQYTDEQDLQGWVKLLTTGVVVSVLDAENKRALIKTPENQIGWAEIPKEEKFPEEEIEKLK